MASDIIALLEDDHRKTAALLAGLEGPAPRRAELFGQVVTELARHEATEEAIVHPVLRDLAPDGEAAIDPILEEEAATRALLVAMGAMDPHSSEFVTASEKLRITIQTMPSMKSRRSFRRCEGCSRRSSAGSSVSTSSRSDRWSLARCTTRARGGGRPSREAARWRRSSTYGRSPLTG